MQNGKYSIQIPTGADLSAAANLILTIGGAVQASATATNSIGACEADAATATIGGGETVYATYAGTATCIAGAALTNFGLIMVDPVTPGQVIDHASGAANVAIGRYIPELINGAVPPNAVAGQEVTCYLFASKIVAF